MFTLDTWVTNVDLSNIVKLNIANVTKGKKQYNPTNLKNITINFLNEKYGDYYKIFTDGSKDNCNIGAAFFDPQTNNSLQIKIKCNMNIMRVELIAIAEALSYVESCSSHNYVIFSDSKSALQHLIRCTKKKRGIPIAYNILDCLSRLNNNHKSVIMQWVPAHIGLIENEKVDQLAKEAAVDGLEFSCNTLFSDQFPIVRERCYKLWTEYFDQRSLTKGIWYRTIQPNIHRFPWVDQTRMSRTDITMALRLRAGHVPLNAFAYLMGKVISPMCSVCNIVEDVHHLLAECARGEELRAQLFSRDFNVGKYNSILASPLSDEARMLYNLVNRINVCRS